MNSVILIGYSGHGFVAADIFTKNGMAITGYSEPAEKKINPFQLKFLGKENDEQVKQLLKENAAFVGIGDNTLRKKILTELPTDVIIINAIHPTAIIASYVDMGKGIMIGANAVINSCTTIGDGVIVNTAAIVEHECIIGSYVHLAPGSVLCGNVKVGENSFVGANAVVKQGVTIGKNCIIGAGSVVLKDVEDGKVIVGNPGKEKR